MTTVDDCATNYFSGCNACCNHRLGMRGINVLILRFDPSIIINITTKDC